MTLVVAGVDGCRAGWVMVSRRLADGALTVAVAPHWTGLPQHAATIAVDMPIGLSVDGSRGCDMLARRLLPGRASSVFPVPARSMLDFDTYPQANAWGKARGRGLSKQAWNILPRIRDLDRVLLPADQDRVFEAHPELAFARLNGGTPPPPKRLAEGRARRLWLLRRAGVKGLGPLLRDLPRGVAADDLLDAAALTLTAERILAGRGVRLGGTPPRDARGLRMEIWY
jgi:predicted RNase H-like nuclease